MNVTLNNLGATIGAAIARELPATGKKDADEKVPAVRTKAVVPAFDAEELMRAGHIVLARTKAADPAEVKVAAAGVDPAGAEAAALRALYSTAPAPKPAETPADRAAREVLGRR